MLFAIGGESGAHPFATRYGRAMKSILVAGGAGYIGSHVVLSFLRAGHRVTVLDNLSTGRQANLFEGVSFVHGDVQDRTLLRDVLAQNYDAAIHLTALKAAGESMEFPERYARQNISGTLNLLEAVSNSATRCFIFSSSAAVYGTPEFLPISEEHPLRPANFYGFTKLEIERLLAWYDRLKGIKFACLRYFNAAGYDANGEICGLESNPANLLPVVMETACGKRDRLQVFGNDFPTKDGTGVRDYIHATDLADAHLKAFETVSADGRSLTVNLGTGRGHSVMEVVRMTERVTGREVPFEMVARRKGDPPELFADSRLANRLLHWTPQFSDLKTVVDSTWQAYRRQKVLRPR